jgi:hypothetical protein
MQGVFSLKFCWGIRRLVASCRRLRFFFSIALAHFAGVKSIKHSKVWELFRRIAVRVRVTRGPENVKMSVAQTNDRFK